MNVTIKAALNLGFWWKKLRKAALNLCFGRKKAEKERKGKKGIERRRKKGLFLFFCTLEDFEIFFILIIEFLMKLPSTVIP